LRRGHRGSQRVRSGGHSRRRSWVELLESRYLLTASPLFETAISPPPTHVNLNAGAGSTAEAFPLAETFFLNSLPGATKTIYLDFTGFTTVNTQWNSAHQLPIILTPAFDTDGNINAFSEPELLLIQEIWERVSEDFRPFEVNVTTEDPGVEALRNTGGTDDAWGQRVAIGGSDNDWFDPAMPLSAGGVAHINAFNASIDDPCFVFAADFGPDAQSLAEVISHEAGHTLGLLHDSQFRFYEDIGDMPPALKREFVQYYAGHGTGETHWAPIMGVGYGVALTQWSKGEYFNATNDAMGVNPLQDDLDIITNRGGTNENGFGYRADDHGSDTGTATPLSLQNEDTIYFGEGIIERNTDVDYFAFTVEGLGEVVSFDISPFHVGANLDVLARLYNGAGVQIAVSNPLDGIAAGGQTSAAFSDGGWVVTNSAYNSTVIDPGVSFALPPGDYYITIEGGGRPTTFIDPAIHPGPVQADPPMTPIPPDTSDWGYSNYGSLGYYQITGTRQKGLVVGIDFDAAGGVGPSDWNLFSGGGPSNQITNLISETGSTTPYDLLITTTGTAVQGFASESPIDAADLPDHALPLDNLDGYLATGGETLSFVWSDLEPGAVYQVYVFGHADQEARNVVEIIGGEWAGAQQTYNFTQVIDQNQLVVNDTPEPGNLRLPTLSKLVVANELGEITINVTNEIGYAIAVAGLAIAPTKLGSIEGRKWNDENGNRLLGGGEEGLGGWTIYLDLNNNGQLDLVTTPEQPVTVQAPNVPQPLLDHNTVKNELVFTQPGQIIDVDITLDITHTYDGDLDVYLKSPTGTRVKLFDDVGGFNDNFTNTTLDDEAFNSILNGTAPFNGRFQPEELLAFFDGESALGTWELEITDDALNDTGVLNGWSITITLAALDTYLEPVTVTQADGSYGFFDLLPGVYHVREHFAEQQFLDGWRQTWQPPPVTVTSGASVRNINFGNWIPTTQRGSIQGVKFNDANGNGVKDEGEAGLEGWTVFIDSNGNGVRDIASAPVTVASTDVPQPIVDFSSVATQVDFQGVGRILNIEVTLDIAHSFMGDLDAFLTSPAGRTVELFTDVGGQYNDFQNLTLADNAAESVADIESFYNPETGYTGRWRPEGLLSDFNGEEATGIWTLLIRDNAFADQGALQGWSLTITFGELTATTQADDPNTTTDETGFYLFENLPEAEYIIREEPRPGWVQVPPANTSIVSAVWANGQWTVNVVGLDDPNDPNGPDSRRNVKNVNFGNSSAGPALPGDYNVNGTVDAADYVLWRKFLSANVSPPFSGADGNGNGTVDQPDYGVWRANFGDISGGGASAPVAESITVPGGTSAPVASAETKPEASEPAAPAADSSPAPTTTFALSDSLADAPRRHAVVDSTRPTAAFASDRALVAWLASLGKVERSRSDDDAAESADAPWYEDVSDSLDPLDSVFERLGAAVA
jgi:subtilisin-like proprotein convertase family protein